MHLKGIPRDVGDCIDRSLCGYSNFFPKFHVFYVPAMNVVQNFTRIVLLHKMLRK